MKMVSSQKCALITFLALTVTSVLSLDDATIFDKGYRSLYRIYEECQLRGGGVTPCLKKKAINFFERLGRIDNLSIADNLELVRVNAETSSGNFSYANNGRSLERDLDIAMARNSGASRDDLLNDVLLDRITNLMNSFNVQIKLPKTSSSDLKRSIEEGRGKMKKMMGMMMMGMAMKMAAMIPITMGVLFLLAGKALIISKIALVLSLIMGLKKLLSQKQGGGDSHHSGWQSGGSGGGGGWDRSLKPTSGLDILDSEKQDTTQVYAHNLAYGAHKNIEK